MLLIILKVNGDQDSAKSFVFAFVCGYAISYK